MPSSFFARAADQNDDGIMTEEQAKAAPKDNDKMVIKEFNTREDLLASTTPMIAINSIEPEQGPISGK